ncbi:MAG TPA: S24 family peptidase [Micromonosporaceae bacterium]|nr:S24 family peptidase [Micromonosporaceae bacterium]
MSSPTLLLAIGVSDAERIVYTVTVVGPSMVPALRHGDALVVRRSRRGRPGAVAVVRFAGDPHLYVKRLSHLVDGGWWALGDNPYGSSDSRDYGPAVVVGRVLFRWWPRPSRVPRC